MNNQFDDLSNRKETKSQKEEMGALLHQANLMCDHYSELLGTSNAVRMKKLIVEIQQQDDFLVNVKAMEELKELVKEHQFILTIYLLKIAANKASKSNPSEANFLLKQHDSVVAKFKDGNFENGFLELAESWEVAQQYFDEDGENEFGRLLKR